MFTALVIGVIAPISIAFFVDSKLGTLPVATIIAIILFMPIGAIWLARVSLNELNQVIEEIAPGEPNLEESDWGSSDGEEQP